MRARSHPYLKHLATGPGDNIPIYHHQSGRFQGWMSEAIANELLARGKLKAIGDRSAIRQLVSLGADSAEHSGYDRSEGTFFYRPEKYSYRRESEESPQHYGNPVNCWTLTKIDKRDRAIFIEILIGIFKQC